jgi:hypothetical protein
MTGMTIPSIGDVLMLSQTSWKIGRNFASDKKPTPEFVEIATELNRLTKALKRLAESLFEDGTESFVSLIDQYSQDGIAVILLSCRRTLDDLESLTDQYQVVKRIKTAGGYTIERSWSDLILSNINGMIWTAEGHSIHILKEIIAMHSITVAMVKSVLDR